MDILTESQVQSMSGTELKSLINHGILRIVNTTNKDPDEITYKDYPEYKKHAHLAGCEIHISEASRKYDVPHGTISRWVKRGLITVLGKDKNRVLIDEADIAYCAEVRNNRSGQGRWVFADDGTPYSATTRDE